MLSLLQWDGEMQRRKKKIMKGSGKQEGCFLGREGIRAEQGEDGTEVVGKDQR